MAMSAPVTPVKVPTAVLSDDGSSWLASSDASGVQSTSHLLSRGGRPRTQLRPRHITAKHQHIRQQSYSAAAIRAQLAHPAGLWDSYDL
ncbi:hypothetical protein Dda_0558 [Drechslerella dactyloides]|uniref:Uncharacterized protein n=1 Tax=Drechslerella dactyloides TaxID=74499 RepID=A0AAD6NN48_DREDA|nr:hypothetical protein Dda_0558 [Drechslerella dactyloides]